MTQEEFEYDYHYSETFREKVEEQESIRAWQEELEAEEYYHKKKQAKKLNYSTTKTIDI